MEPRLKGLEQDGDLAGHEQMEDLSDSERGGLFAAVIAMGLGLGVLALTAFPETSAWRAPDGALAASNAPLMKSIVPLIFLMFIIPGIVYGYVAGTVATHRDVIQGMTQAMSGMGYYIVMAFFAALFIQ